VALEPGVAGAVTPSRSRALVLMPRAPWPQDDGGRVLLWQDLLALAARFDTHLVVMHTGPGPRPAVPGELTALGVRVSFVPHQIPAAPWALLRGVLGKWPYTLTRYHSDVFAGGLRAIVREWRPDLVFINHLHLATYERELTGCVRVLRQQNLEQLWLERYARSARNPAVAAYATLQARRMQKTEAELCARMDLILAVHEDEAAAMRAFTPGAPVEAVPVGATFVEELGRPPSAAPTLLLIGSFDRGPNAEGAERFLNEGWPLVRARMPAAQLRIVGRQMPARLIGLARAAGAEPVGFVPDVAREFAHAHAIVIPVWVGAGVRVKTVEAIAAGLPVVCTPLGVEGLRLEAGLHYLEGTTGAALGEGALELLAHPVRAAQIAAAAYAAARPRFARDVLMLRTADLCEQALSRTGSVRASEA
jgi:glycosyltransferase involved in cell wall biosynthesis